MKPDYVLRQMNRVTRLIAGRFRKSVYFFALHRGGSSVLGGMLGKSGLQHIDYARDYYAGLQPNLRFPKSGCAFGPLRLSSQEGPERALVDRVTQPKFLKDKNCIFMLRDPRDILVSAYYSFGFSHGLSDAPDIREGQERFRSEIQAMSIDEFVLRRAPIWLAVYVRTGAAIAQATDPVVVTFEEMVNDFDSFARKLTRYLPLPRSALHELHDETRPRTTEAPDAHKRSGQVGGFRGKLQEGTIAELNSILERPLTQFGFC